MSDYEEFLEAKAVTAPTCGKDVPLSAIHATLFPFQREIVRWAVRRGRAAIWADTGLGKTLMQLEWARQIGGRCLILAPLAVAHQTIAEGKKIGLEIAYAKTAAEIRSEITITNYERLAEFDATPLDAVVLDESSILKNYTGKTRRALQDRFAATPFKLACTATPAPNDHMEIGNHSEFLGVMDSNEMLARWFINDAMQAGNYRLKGHAAADFWRWVTEWAVCCAKPSDIGPFDDSGYVLPPMNVDEVFVEVPGRFLVDDWDKHAERWREHGGEAILFPRIWNSAHAERHDPLAVVAAALRRARG